MMCRLEEGRAPLAHGQEPAEVLTSVQEWLQH